MKRSDGLLAATALAILALVVYRACTQAITIDEATTYVIFVAPDLPQHWLGSTNNHVLNTALIRLSTLVFGVAEWSVRLPAMLGAAIYLTACVRFCRRLERGLWLRWIALLCLAASPFILDYLVAARGYSLALGFLMAALLCDPLRLRGILWISTLLGLCFVANFSFAFVCAATGAILLIRSWKGSGLARPQLIAAYTTPALLIVWIVAAEPLLKFPREELWHGAHSLRESFSSLADSQTRHLNLQLLGIPLYRVLYKAQPFLYPLLAIVTAAWLAASWRRAPSSARFLGGIFGGTLLLHAVGFHLAGLLYPLDRTGIFLVPLFFGAIAAMASVPAIGGRRWLRRAQVGMLSLVALNNLACLRVSYFEEWNFNQETDKLYSMTKCLHDRHQVTASTEWPFVSVMDFYRFADPASTLPPFLKEQESFGQADVVVGDAKLTPWVLEQDGRIPLWRSALTPAYIAAAPEHAERLKGSSCFEK